MFKNQSCCFWSPSSWFSAKETGAKWRQRCQVLNSAFRQPSSIWRPQSLMSLLHLCSLVFQKCSKVSYIESLNAVPLTREKLGASNASTLCISLSSSCHGLPMLFILLEVESSATLGLSNLESHLQETAKPIKEIQPHNLVSLEPLLVPKPVLVRFL